VRQRENSSNKRALLSFAPCGIDLSSGSHKVALTAEITEPTERKERIFINPSEFSTLSLRALRDLCG
jgi:hypothetical protein